MIKVKIFLLPIITFFLIDYLIAQSPNAVFTKLIGNEAHFDTSITIDYLNVQPGKKIYLDTDKDSRIDVIYMIDTDERHGDTRQPLLVKIIDEDGDMYESFSGDYDSDLYIADWYGDGTIDRAIDYHDLDNDNDVDEQYLYGFRGDEFYVAWAKDYGDDNRLWYDVNYEYSQFLTQWLTDFNGDEMFVYWLRYDYELNTLTPCMENAFSFYDLDGDTYSEEVVRFSGTGRIAEDLRYSMDLDNDNEFNEPYHHDYDFSISCLGPIDIPLQNCHTLDIRSIQTEPVTRWENMRDVAKNGNWVKIHLTWDENDNNITLKPGRKYYERWEGVLNHPNDYMPQVGGPSCGPFNKRNEIDLDASGKMQFYMSVVDYRLHLFGAEIGFINVDYDYDEVNDMLITLEDRDKNGYFDTWKYDVDGDSLFDLIDEIGDDSSEVLPFEYMILQDKFIPALNKNLDQNSNILPTLEKILFYIKGENFIEPIARYFDDEIYNYGQDYKLGAKIKNSPEGNRYYQDLIRIRLWHLFRQEAIACGWQYKEIEEEYINGKFKKAAELLEYHLAHDDFLLPSATKLFHNYPNPFNKETVISYYLPEQTHVNITIYTISGQKVETLVNYTQDSGHHSIKWHTVTHASGLYFCDLNAGNVHKKVKMLMVK